ncbi:MAG: gliding motility-associated C-terminal domain-containing protein [Chitinophagales bacterium]|nr:gliding motility-associated C-terminal domain-containing protein [Chitinophagales bacterium]
MKKTYAFLLAFCLSALLIPLKVNASHALGADITYECIGPNTYRILYSFYRDCDGITPSTTVTLNYSSASCGVSGTISLSPNAGCCTPTGLCNQDELPGVCNSAQSQTTCNGGSLPGVEVWTYCGTLTLPQQCSDWVIYYGECCRNSAITNIPGADAYDGFVFANINNASGTCNNSPFYTSNPSELFCAGFSYCYNQGAVDIDGDSLAFSLVAPLSALNTPITGYAAGLSPTNPMSTVGGNSFTFDSTTGQMCFTPDVSQAAVVAVEVREYRRINGVTVLVGTTRRDIQFQVLASGLCSGAAPSSPELTSTTGAAFLDSVTLQMCNGGTVAFNVVSIDSSGTTNLTMTSNATTAIPGSTFNITAPNDTVTGSFSWTPGIGDTGLYFFTVTVQNDACPVPRSVTQTIKVFVYSTVVAASSAPAFCGDSVQLSAIGGSIFNWTPAAGLSNPNIANPQAGPTVPTTYTVTTECGSDTITIGVGASYNVVAAPDDTICLNGSTTITANVTGGNGPFTYSWTPTTPAGSISNPTSASPIVSPPATTTYTVVATSSEGCRDTSTALITVQGVAPNITATATPDTVCPGGTVVLDISTAPQSCGLSTRPCITSNIDYTLGSGTQFGTTTSAPAIYGHFYEGTRMQILYRASELQALGITGGTISQIAWNIAQINGTTQYCSFSIKLGCTNLTALTSSWQGNMLTVLNPRTVSITTGWNNYVLDNSFDWDGVSNIILEVCYSNDPCQTTYTNNSPTYYTTTSYNSVAYVRQDNNANICVTTTNPTTSTQRPNTRFSICQQGLLPGAVVSWTPTTGLSNPNDNNPLAQVFNTTTYTANVTEGACVGSGFVTVVVDNSLQLTATPQDTSLCVPTPITLTAAANGIAAPVQLTCGVNGTLCGGPVATDTVGTAAQLTTATTPYKGSEYEGRIQMLFRGSELQNVGFSRGIINSLAFNVSNKGSAGQFQQFTIRMGCTNSDTLGSFATTLTDVYGPANVTTVTNWNTYNLTNPFDWDGYSNIIIEVCFGNGFNSIGDDIIRATPSGFSSVLTVATSSFSGISGCDITDPPTSSSLRPDVLFGICAPPPGQFYYTWTPILGTGPVLTGDTVTVTPTASVTYRVEVTDSFCYAYDTVDIEFLNGYSANLTGRNIGCSGTATGDIVSSPTQGASPYDFQWGDASGTVIRSVGGLATDTITGLAAGTYFVTLTDANGCLAVDSITLTVPPALVIDSISVTDVGCNGQSTGAAFAYISGGTPPYDLAWSSGDSTASITNLPAGNYSLVVTDSSGCQATDFITVTEPAAIQYTLDSTDVSCANGSDGSATITITSGGSGNFTYRWSNAVTTPSNPGIPAGTYVVTVTDVVGNCSFVDSIVVNQRDSFIITISGIQDASCFNVPDGQASASVGGDIVNYTFLWNSNETTPTAIALPAGVVTVQVTDTSGCMQTATATVGAPPRFTLSFVTTNVTCNGGNDGTATVNTSGGFTPFTYQWNDPQNQTGQTATGLSANVVYTVTVTDANGCPEFADTSLSEPPAIALVVDSVPASCFGAGDGSVSVTASGGASPYTYLWSDGSTTSSVSGLQQGTYSVVVTDGNGCTASTSVTVGQPTSALRLREVNVINVSCYGENNGGIFAVAEGGTPGYTYELNGAMQQTEGNYITLPASNGYQLRVTDANNCFIDTLLDVIEPEPFTVQFIPEVDSVEVGDTVQLQPLIIPADITDRYAWLPSTYLDCDSCNTVNASPPTTTVYEVTVTRNETCPKTAQIEVVVINNKVLYVPNAFSPDGDGFNDYFEVYTKGAEQLQMRIFDKWGSLIYSYQGPIGGKWDGKFKDKILPPDTFVYYIEVTYKDNQKRSSKGSVTIIK